MTQSENDQFPISFIKENPIAVLLIGIVTYYIISSAFKGNEQDQKAEQLQREMERN